MSDDKFLSDDFTLAFDGTPITEVDEIAFEQYHDEELDSTLRGDGFPVDTEYSWSISLDSESLPFFLYCRCYNCGAPVESQRSLKYCSAECEREAWDNARETLEDAFDIELPVSRPLSDFPDNRGSGGSDRWPTSRIIDFDIEEWAIETYEDNKSPEVVAEFRAPRMARYRDGDGWPDGTNVDELPNASGSEPQKSLLSRITDVVLGRWLL